MLYSKDIDLEDRIVQLVTEGRMTIKSLHSLLKSEKRLSLRAVYKAVNKLMEAGVLLKAGKHILISEEWSANVRELLGSSIPPLLAKGERATYSFVSIEHLDAFWKTTILPLELSATSNEIFFYNPHNFWAYLPGRKESEDAYYKHFSLANRYGFFTIGGDSTADLGFKRELQSEHLQIDLRDIETMRRTDHITLISDFIISVRLSKRVSENIDQLYATGKEIEEILPEIEKICRKPGKIRFLIENSPVEAAKLKKLLAKNFYFKKS